MNHLARVCFGINAISFFCGAAVFATPELKEMTPIEAKSNHHLTAKVSYTEKAKRPRAHRSYLRASAKASSSTKKAVGTISLEAKHVVLEAQVPQQKANPQLTLAAKYDHAGDYVHALEAAENALRIANENKAAGTKDYAPLFASLATLSSIYEHQGNLSKSEHYCEYEMNVRQNYAPNDPGMVPVLERYAKFVRRRGANEFATQLESKAAQMRKRKGQNDSRKVASSNTKSSGQQIR